MTDRFTDRENAGVAPVAIQVRNDAPSHLRTAVVTVSLAVGLSASDLRTKLEYELAEDLGDDWGYDYIVSACKSAIRRCDWPCVYDAIEGIYEEFGSASFAELSDLDEVTEAQEKFSRKINQVFLRHGIGWSLTGGKVVFRGDELFEENLELLNDVLADSTLTRAHLAFSNARLFLSERPGPRIEDAVRNSFGCLEAVCREICRRATGTDAVPNSLPSVLKKIGVSPPLDDVVAKSYGFASNTARHLDEKKSISLEEAELVIGLMASITSFLLKQSGMDHEI